MLVPVIDMGYFRTPWFSDYNHHLLPAEHQLQSTHHKRLKPIHTAILVI